MKFFKCKIKIPKKKLKEVKKEINELKKCAEVKIEIIKPKCPPKYYECYKPKVCDPYKGDGFAA